MNADGQTYHWPGHGYLSEERFRALRRNFRKAYEQHAVIDLLPEEVDRVEMFLRLVLGGPGKRSAGRGRIWEHAGIVLCNDRAQVRWVGQPRQQYQYVMNGVWGIIEPEDTGNDPPA